ncbi:MAG: lysophospholipid acyltransferase family protein [Actinomycetes bacterium]
MFYAFWRTVIVVTARLLFGVRTRGAEHLPRSGVYILAPSHRSTLDIPFSASVTRRRLRFMAKSQIFNGVFWTWVFDELGAVPVDRDGSDRAALQAIESALRAGEPVVVFPEGTRRSGPALGPIYSGAAYLAYRVGVPLVPVGIGGSEYPFRRWFGVPGFSRVTVVVGEPFTPEKVDGDKRRDAVARADAELLARMQACFDEAVEWSDHRSRHGRITAKARSAKARWAAADRASARPPGAGGRSGSVPGSGEAGEGG